MISDEVEDWVIFLVRVGALSVHFLEVLGLSIGSTVAVVLLVEECIEIYKDHKIKVQLKKGVKIEAKC